MTTMRTVERTCKVCGKRSYQRELTSTSSFGSPDLDLRPPMLKRATMDLWYEKCPHCGYVNTTIEKDGSLDGIDEAEYFRLEGTGLSPDIFPIAADFYRMALVKGAAGEPMKVFDALLYAAWVCDDMDQDANARILRKKSLEALEACDESEFAGEEGTWLIMKADVERRAGMFEDVIDGYSETELEDELLNRLLAFEVEKARAKDTRCYTVAQAIGED